MSAELVTVVLAGQRFGIPVLEVRDVLGPQKIARIPLASPEIAGALNLRGRIVVAIDLRIRLGLPPATESAMSVVVEHGGEPYSLLVDSVGEVLYVGDAAFEPNPPTLDAHWRAVSAGLYRLADGLLVLLDVARALDLPRRAA